MSAVQLVLLSLTIDLCSTFLCFFFVTLFSLGSRGFPVTFVFFLPDITVSHTVTCRQGELGDCGGLYYIWEKTWQIQRRHCWCVLMSRHNRFTCLRQQEREERCLDESSFPIPPQEQQGNQILNNKQLNTAHQRQTVKEQSHKCILQKL